jgi:hypothetical protein
VNRILVVSPEELRLLGEWTPVGVDFSGSSPWVRWADLRRVRFDDPFFDQSVQRALCGGDGELVETGPEALVEVARASAHVGPTGLFFHAGRCGSTLVANALGLHAGTVVLKEPVCLSQALLSDPGGRHREWLQALMRCLCVRRSAEHRATIVKLTSWNALRIERLRALFPDVPCAFLYRDPVETIVSLLERPPALHRELRAGLLPLPGAIGASTEDLFARFLGAVYDAALVERDLTLVNYTELSTGGLEAIAARFGVHWSAAERARVDASRSKDAKATDASSFTPDAHSKQRRATADARDAVRRFSLATYETLESRRRRSAEKLPLGEPRAVPG